MTTATVLLCAVVNKVALAQTACGDPPCQHAEITALRAFRKAQPASTREDGKCLSNWYGDKHCDWKGVTCNKRGQVVCLGFSNYDDDEGWCYSNDEGPFNGCGLKSAPPSAAGLEDVEGLCLKGNLLTAIPNIDKWQKLVLLDLSRNRLKSLPEGLHLLPNLEELRVGANLLETLPRGLQLKRLTYLDASSNRLTGLDTKFGDGLPNLEELFLSRNNLTALPDSIGHISRLVRFSLENNPHLTALPQFGDQAHLTELYLSKSGLTYVRGGAAAAILYDLRGQEHHCQSRIFM